MVQFVLDVLKTVFSALRSLGVPVPKKAPPVKPLD